MDSSNLTVCMPENEIVFRNERFYHQNGKIKLEQFFIDGNFLFKEVHYNEDGTVNEIINYRSDGTTWSNQEFKNGEVKSGLTLTYYEDGSVQSQKYYVENKVHWTERIFNRKGQLIEVIGYSKGIKNGQNIFFDENSNKVGEINYRFNNPDGSAKFYYPNGKLKAEINYYRGHKTGISRIYYKNGILKSEENLRNDIRNGVTKTFYENGNIKEEWNFKNGKPDGSSKTYYKNGVISGIINYKNGTEEGISTYYYQNGNLKQEIFYTKGTISGTTKIYKEDGTFDHEINYSDSNSDKGYAVPLSESKIDPIVKYKVEKAVRKADRRKRIIRSVNYALLFSVSVAAIYILYILTLCVI